jgi:hypothetical protein
MHYEEIELNFDASCQQILGLESKIVWEARRTLMHYPKIKSYGTNSRSFPASHIERRVDYWVNLPVWRASLFSHLEGKRAQMVTERQPSAHGHTVLHSKSALTTITHREDLLDYIYDGDDDDEIQHPKCYIFSIYVK